LDRNECREDSDFNQKMKKEITFKNMTVAEAKKHFGTKLWKKMLDTGLLSGITCKIGKDGKLIIYACDLENAYNKVVNGRELFFD